MRLRTATGRHCEKVDWSNLGDSPQQKMNPVESKDFFLQQHVLEALRKQLNTCGKQNL